MPSISMLVPFGALVGASRSTVRTGMGSSELRPSTSSRRNSTRDRLPFRVVSIRSTSPIPNAADLPVPKRPRPGRPFFRSTFSPCITKKFCRPRQSIPRPLSEIEICFLRLLSTTFTRGLVPASTYWRLFDTYSQTTSLSVLKTAAFCNRSLATCVFTKSWFSAFTIVPTSVGLWRPTVLLPGQALDHLRRY